MPKIKTNSSLKRRVKITATGKVLCKYGFTGHNTRKKSHRARKQNIGMKVASSFETKMFKKMGCMSLRKK